MRKIPMRKCLATNNSFPKNELIRIVRTPEGEVKVDLTGKLNGKGAYVSKDIKALEILKKKNLLNNTLGVSVSEDIFKELETIING